MPFTREFLDWSQPALPAVGEWLLQRYGGDGVVDLSGVVVVLSGRRAARRLVEILLERTEGRLLPPQMITEGEFPELLYEPQRPFAGELVQHLAWAEAVRRMPRPVAEHVIRDVPDDGDVDGWMALGELLWGLHRELAAELLDFGDVLREGERIAEFNERRRWEALQVAQREYLDLLDGLGLWDKQTARIVAVRERECRTERDIVLVGTVDLNRSTRKMLDLVADRVTALIPAPDVLSDRFDEHGCLRPEAWQAAPIALSREQVRIVDQPLDQADEVVRVLASLDGRYRADDITIGLADSRLVPHVRRRLEQWGVTTRWAVGRPLVQTAVVRFLDAVAGFLTTERAEDFARLVRHPDVGTWLADRGVEPLWLQDLDDYLNEHLPQKLGSWRGSGDRWARVKRVHRLVTRLLSAVAGEARPLSEWPEVLLELLRRLLGKRAYDPQVAAENDELEAVALLMEAFEAQQAIPAPLMPVVSGPQALRLTLDALAQVHVPPIVDESAVELTGWLDLPLDDAPVLVVTSFNERFVPASVSSDLFLPNRLRQQMGVLDNDRRYARDAYALSAIAASRARLILIAGRRDERGDPLLPSRLLFACEADEAAARVMSFYKSPLVRSLPITGPGTLPSAGRGIVVPRPPTPAESTKEVSVTAFRTYLACPYRFYLRHVLKLESIPDEVDELDAAVFGTLVHTALGEFAASELKDSTSVEEISEFLRDRVDAWAHRKYGRFPQPAVRVQLEQARRRLDAFAHWQAARTQAGWSIAFAEVETEGAFIQFDVGDGRSIHLKGRIDRIDRHAEDETWALIDYKTGDASLSPEKAHRRKGEWIDLQLPLYRHLARSLGVAGAVELGFVTLPRDTSEVRERMAEWSEAVLSSADEKAREVGRNILDGCFWPPEGKPPRYPDDFSAICQDAVFDRRLAE